MGPSSGPDRRIASRDEGSALRQVRQQFLPEQRAELDVRPIEPDALVTERGLVRPYWQQEATG